MDGGTSGAIIAFALGTLPGVIVLETLVYGRPPVRDRKGARALGQFLLLSLAAWTLAVLVFDAGGSLVSVLDATTGTDRVDAYEALAWRLFASAVLVGAALRIAAFALQRYANWYIEHQDQIQLRLAVRTGKLAVSLASLTSAWDDLLARLRRSEKPQLVHVRFTDGSEAFGVFAGTGRADFQADGRGLVLAAEYIQRDGQLVPIDRSTGLFIAPDAVASVGFIDHDGSA